MAIFKDLQRTIGEDIDEYNRGCSGWHPNLRFAAARKHAVLNLPFTLQKKFIGEEDAAIVSKADRDAEAWQSFLKANRHMEMIVKSGRIESLPVSGYGDDLRIAPVFGRAVQILWDVLSGPDCSQKYLPDLFSLAGAMRHGPGTVAGVSQMLTSCIKTCTVPMGFSDKDALDCYDRIMLAAPRLRKTAEAIRRDAHGTFFTDAEFIAVPKNERTSRGIMSQPAGNMQVQLSLGDHASLACLRLGVDLARQQDINRELAWWGSQQHVTDVHDGKYLRFCTLDLKDASDRIPRNVPDVMFPPMWAYLIRTFRSKYVKYKDPNGKVNRVEKFMMSGMGNGFTFPIMTLLFSSIVKASYEYLGLKQYVSPSSSMGCCSGALLAWAVNGDDIIVLEEAFDLVVDCLHALGAKVNRDKTYSTGSFRESCGGDYLEGFPVRGVYVERLDTVQHHLSLLNRLNVWSCYYAVPLVGTCKLLRDAITRLSGRRPRPILTDDGFDEGMMVQPDDLVYHQDFRSLETSPGLHRYKKYRVVKKELRWLPFVKANTLRLVNDLDSLETDETSGLTLKSVEIRVTAEAPLTAPDGKPWNWQGMLMHYITGHIREGAETIRESGEGPPYKTISCVTPCLGKPWKYRTGHDHLWFEPSAPHDAARNTARGNTESRP